MQNILIITFLFVAFVNFQIMGQIEDAEIKAERYKTQKFDVAIFPADYKDFIGGERFFPSKAEVDRAEAALISDLKSLNEKKVNQSSSPIIHKNLNKYRRQYFGFIDQNGDRILLINCFWHREGADDEDWLKERFVVLDGGSYYWSVRFNLTTGKLFDLKVNGYA